MRPRSPQWGSRWAHAAAVVIAWHAVAVESCDCLWIQDVRIIDIEQQLHQGIFVGMQMGTAAHSLRCCLSLNTTALTKEAAIMR